MSLPITKPELRTKVTLKKLSNGFSLIELMVTIAVGAIMLTIAVPSLGDLIDKMRVDNEVSQLNRLVLAARNSAITNEQSVTLCPLGSNNACTNNWDGELSLFIDLDSDGIFEPQAPVVPPVPIEVLIKIKGAADANDTITYTGPNRITFAPTGAITSGAGTFAYCPSSDSDLARGIVLTVSGRSYLSTDANSDGKDEFRNKTNVSLSCPP